VSGGREARGGRGGGGEGEGGCRGCGGWGMRGWRTEDTWDVGGGWCRSGVRFGWRSGEDREGC